MTIEERLEQISLDWFLLEPALFKVLCTHKLIANESMQCPVRCGQRRIEYNPVLTEPMKDQELSEHLKAECIRILLKHPYERQPSECHPIAISLGSNCVLADNYKFQSLKLLPPQEFELESGMHFEFYAKEINKRISFQQEPQSGQADTSALWQEDSMQVAEINEMIHSLEAANSWGSLPGHFVGKIIASTRVKIDYRKVMQSFRAEILSSKRRLTRMKPNRRSGFQNFGSVYKLTSRLLVAIDVSGSTTDEYVSDFFGIVNKFFKYGIEEIDVVQFDTELKGEPETLKKAKQGGINILGRGGTDFQLVIDFVHAAKNYYQGVLIMTDGYADKPKLPDYYHTPILFVLPSESLYEQHKSWMEKIGRACFIEKR